MAIWDISIYYTVHTCENNKYNFSCFSLILRLLKVPNSALKCLAVYDILKINPINLRNEKNISKKTTLFCFCSFSSNPTPWAAKAAFMTPSSSSCLVFLLSFWVLQATEYTQSGNDHFLAYIPSWWKNQPSLVRGGGGARPPPFYSIYLHVQCYIVRSSWEGRYTPPVSTLPLYVLCGRSFAYLRYSRGWGVEPILKPAQECGFIYTVYLHYLRQH